MTGRFESKNVVFGSQLPRWVGFRSGQMGGVLRATAAGFSRSL